MRILPRTVANLVTQSTDAARVRDNLSSAVQPTLNFLNSYFQAASDGSLRILQTLIVRALTVNGDVNQTGNNNIVGNLNVNPGKVFVQAPAGSTDLLTVVPTTVGQVMKLTNIGNTQINTGATSDGTFFSQAFISANGFKSFLDGGTFGSSGAAANTWAQHQRIVSKGGTFATQNLVQPMGWAGSVVGIAMQYQGNTTNNISIKVQKNNADLWVYNNIYTGATNGALVCKTVAKGTYNFSPQDFLTVLSSYSTGTDVLLQVTLIIEQTA